MLDYIALSFILTLPLTPIILYQVAQKELSLGVCTEETAYGPLYVSSSLIVAFLLIFIVSTYLATGESHGLWVVSTFSYFFLVSMNLALMGSVIFE